MHTPYTNVVYSRNSSKIEQLHYFLQSNSSYEISSEQHGIPVITKLNEVIELDGNREVSLREAAFPSKADREMPDKCFIAIYIAGGKYHEVKLPAGHYAKPDDILVAMKSHNAGLFGFSHNLLFYVIFRKLQRKRNSR